ncbi:putative Aldehyde-alcohol dehydrogenase 2 [Blattamonas nauphoetae]|uniref:Aldehyde-alcohol dehydrogenase 2 n=1 Tax=Blattamonas nauphoetae TaxID=2049346 RepID=A0ABQ9YJJ9_9EUKA|nr:putative Aldehyde-alcohol dehydrogenase 2 [Blattamonas nauphoetae]
MSDESKTQSTEPETPLGEVRWFQVPPKIYFENDSIQYMEKMKGISRAFFVTDKTIRSLGYVTKVLFYLRRRQKYCHSEIFSKVDTHPDLSVVMEGVTEAKRFNADVIVALGGGSVIDAAKMIWLYLEHPELIGEKLSNFTERVTADNVDKYPVGEKIQFVAIPTTSGTGSEMSNTLYLTDLKNGKDVYSILSFDLTPNVAILDAQMAVSQSEKLVADSGVHVLSNAIESLVARNSSDYTVGQAIQVIELVFGNLELSIGGDRVGREKMHNAASVCGMAVTNSHLGLCHALAVKLGLVLNFHRGRLHGVLLPYVMRFNERFEGVSNIYARAGYSSCITETKSSAATIKAVEDLLSRIGIPRTLKECGIDEKHFIAIVDDLAASTLTHGSALSNPQPFTKDDLKALLLTAYHGK